MHLEQVVTFAVQSYELDWLVQQGQVITMLHVCTSPQGVLVVFADAEDARYSSSGLSCTVWVIRMRFFGVTAALS